jgi:hypothetical protein
MKYIFDIGETPICGKPLITHNTTFIMKIMKGTRLIAEPNGNNL